MAAERTSTKIPKYGLLVETSQPGAQSTLSADFLPRWNKMTRLDQFARSTHICLILCNKETTTACLDWGPLYIECNTFQKASTHERLPHFRPRICCIPGSSLWLEGLLLPPLTLEGRLEQAAWASRTQDHSKMEKTWGTATNSSARHNSHGLKSSCFQPCRS